MTRRLAAEFTGTLLLLATVVGSGIMGEQLAGGNDAIALLGNTIATGAILVVLILMFGAISGAHLQSGRDPGVPAARRVRHSGSPAVLGRPGRGRPRRHAHRPTPCSTSPSCRSPPMRAPAPASGLRKRWLPSGSSRQFWPCCGFVPRRSPMPWGFTSPAGYWFTASTSFANPAVTVARSFTDSFSGIQPDHAPGFILAQLLGATIATILFRWLLDERG